MKLDIVRAFDLSDAELESVYGAGGGALPGGAPLGVGPVGGLGGGLGVGAGEASSVSAAASERIHSFAFACVRNLFSTNRASNEATIFAGGALLPEVGLFSIGNPVSQLCASND